MTAWVHTSDNKAHYVCSGSLVILKSAPIIQMLAEPIISKIMLAYLAQAGFGSIKRYLTETQNKKNQSRRACYNTRANWERAQLNDKYKQEIINSTWITTLYIMLNKLTN